MNQFLKTSGTSIVDAKGQKIQLRGVNFGGWLMMEAYFMHSPNTAEQIMKREFKEKLGAEALAELEHAFRTNFIQESDMRQVADWGFNCVRLPFNYRLIEDGKINFIDEAIQWANKYGVYLILDLHAAPGAQNNDWHSDSLGVAELWKSEANRIKTYKLWEMLANRYKDEPMIAGYDLLNETVLDNDALLNEFYRETIKAIRSVDKNHILFIEGNRWAQDIAMLDDFKDDNWVFSVHFYEPMEYTFTLIQHMDYPVKSGSGEWDIKTMRQRMEQQAKVAHGRGRPIHVGEFGVNYRNGHSHEDLYVKDLIQVFNDLGFNWNYWTYKAVKSGLFPDGILSYYPNPPWVFRLGPVTGWHRWKDVWPEHKNDMIASWRTDQFTLNDKVLDALK
jgi:endoglucanase